MDCLPLVRKELQVAFRKRQPTRSRFWVAALCVGGSLLLLWISAMTGISNFGSFLHEMLCWAGAYIVLQAPGKTAGSFSEERHNQTLGLLFLSGLGVWEVFAGKVLSALMISLTDLMAMFPILALPFLMGGISFDLFLATVWELPNILLFLVAISLLGSILSRDEGVSRILTGVLAAVFCGLPVAIYQAQIHFSPGGAASLWWLRICPVYGPYLVWKQFGTVPVAEFWINAAFTLLLSVICLSSAAYALKRLWREQESSGPSLGWMGRWQQVIHGNRNYRRRLAAKWMDVNPFVCLSARDKRPATLAWVATGGIMALWMICWMIWGYRWLSVINLLITATLINTILAGIIGHAAAKGLAEGRHNGGYEILLTTPLQPAEIVWGQLEAQQWHFRWVTNGVMGLILVFTVSGLFLRSWTPGALVDYILVWGVLFAWAYSNGRYLRTSLGTMWTALNCGSPSMALMKSNGMASSVWFNLFFNFRNGIQGLNSFPSGSALEIFIVSIMTLLAVAIAWGSGQGMDAVETKLVNQFREIAREPVPASDDPVLKRWNHRERIPWGWGAVQDQLHERLVRRETKP